MLKKLFVLPLLLLLAATAFCKTINIYHTSDTHGQYFPREIDGKQIGGFAALAALVENDPLPHLLLDGGDWSTGTAEASLSRGYLSVQLMNLLNYNATTLGSHENDYKDDALLKNIGAAKFDILAANAYDMDLKTYPAKVKPFKTYLVGGKKIAVIGIARSFGQRWGRIEILNNDKNALKKALRDLEKQKPDAIVVLTTTDNGQNNPANLVKSLKGISLVLSGHTTYGAAQSKIINGVTFVRSEDNLKGVSKIALNFNDETGKLESIKPEFITLDTAVTGEEPYVKEVVKSNYKKDLDRPISSANETLFKINPARAEGIIDSPLANIFADLIKNYAKADIAIFNTGNIHNGIEKGPITKRDVLNISSYPNKIMLVNIDGKTLRQLVKEAFKGDRSLFQYSNMQVVYKVKEGKTKPYDILITIDGAPLDDKKIYSAAALDYIALGNSEGAIFKKITDKKPHGNKLASDLFIDYLLRNKAGISPAKTGRIRVEK